MRALGFIVALALCAALFRVGQLTQAAHDKASGFMPEWQPFAGTNCASYSGHADCPNGQHPRRLSSGVEVCDYSFDLVFSSAKAGEAQTFLIIGEHWPFLVGGE